MSLGLFFLATFDKLFLGSLIERELYKSRGTDAILFSLAHMVSKIMRIVDYLNKNDELWQIV